MGLEAPFIPPVAERGDEEATLRGELSVEPLAEPDGLKSAPKVTDCTLRAVSLLIDSRLATLEALELLLEPP